MNIVFHCPQFDDVRASVLNAVTLASPALRVEILPELKELVARLLEPRDAIDLLVIRVVDKEHLDQLAQFRDSLRRIRNAILLPDSHQETIALAHMFHPCLMMCGENGLYELTAVARKLVELADGFHDTSAGSAPNRLPLRGRRKARSPEKADPDNECRVPEVVATDMSRGYSSTRTDPLNSSPTEPDVHLCKGAIGSLGPILGKEEGNHE